MELNSKNFKKLIDKFQKSELIRKSSVAFIFKIVGSLLAYLFLLCITRNVGAEAWGIFALCFAVLNITSIFCRLGVDVALIKFVSSFQNKIAEIKGVYMNGLFLVFISSVFFSILFYCFADEIAVFLFKKEQLSLYFKIISFAIVPFSIVNVNVQTLRGLKKIKEFAFFQYISKFLFAIIFFLLFTKLDNFEEYIVSVYSYTFSVLLILIATLFYINKYFKGTNAKKTINIYKILKTSFPMLFSSSMLLLLVWIDTIMIGIFSTEKNVGIYNVALKLATTTSFILVAVNSIVAPKISETFNNARMHEFRKLVKDSTRIIFFSTLPLLIILFLFPEFLLSFFGKEFIIAKEVFFILLVGQVINVMSGSVGYILQMTGKEKKYQNILLVSLFLNIILNLLLIPIFGIKGAAIASVVSLAFWNLYSVFYIYKKYNILTFITFKI